VHDASAMFRMAAISATEPHLQPLHAGDLSSISARMEELQALQDTLKAGDALAAQVAAQGPAAGDEGGVFLQQLQQWRLHRQQAVAGELQRLQGLKTAAQIRGALSAARSS